MTNVIGVDIGAQGAVALLTKDGDLIDVVDMPCLHDGPQNRRAVNAPLLAGIIYRWSPVHAFVEHVSARPGEGPVGAFAFGRSRGVIEGVCGAAGVPVTFMAPTCWKRAVGLASASKDGARSEAIRRWPRHAQLFSRVKDDGRAEAALIGIAGLLRKSSKASA